MKISRAFKKQIPRVFQRSFQCVSRVFKGIPGKGQIYFKGVSRKFKGNFIGCLKKVSRVF